MALRILWDQYETALLIDTWIAIEHEDIPRREGISNLSKTLRERAVGKGIVIDETFRNENGISMQLNNIERLMRHMPDAERHNTKIFIDMVRMYFTDRCQFNTILKKAKGDRSYMMDNQEQFAHWLSGNVSSNRLSDCYMAITEVEEFAKKKRIIAGTIYDVSDPSVTVKILNAINSDRIFRFTHKKQIRNIVEAAQLYHRYTKENQAKRSSTEELEVEEKQEVQSTIVKPFVAEREPEAALPVQETISTRNSDDVPGHSVEKPIDLESMGNLNEGFDDGILVDFERDIDLAFTKPVSFSYFGDVVSVTSWRKLYVKVCKILFEDYPHVFEELRASSASGDRQYLIYDEEISKRLTTPVAIANGYYVETNRSASDLVRKIKSLLDSCNVDYENLKIHYRKSEKQDVDVSTEYVVKEETDKTAEIYSDPIKTETAKGRSAFSDWLKEQSSNSATIRTTTWAVSRIGEFANTYQIFSELIFNIDDVETLTDAWNRLNEIDEFVEFRKRNSVLTFAFNKYLQYRGGESVSKRNRMNLKQTEPSASERKSNGSNTKVNFINWIIQEGLAESTAFGYASSVTVMDEYARKHGFSSDSFYDISDVSTVNAIWSMLQVDPDFSAFNLEQHNRFSAAMKKYIEFCASGRKNTLINPTQNSSNRRYSRKANHGANTPLPQKHPVQSEFENWLIENRTPAGTVKTYSAAVKRIGDYLLETGKEDRHVFSIFGITRLENIRQNLQSDSAYGNFSGEFNSLDLYALRKYINFRKNDSSDAVDEEMCGRYLTVLRENFDNGYRVNSMIDRNRFKQYYIKLYGTELQQDDEHLVETIQKVGQVQDDRVFVCEIGEQNNLLDDIQAAIAKVFHQDASCVFVSAVFERYQNELASQLQIYTEDVLSRRLLDTCYGFYQMTRNYFHIRGRVPNAEADVARVMKQSQLPLNYQQIHEILWYIPLDLIKHSLVITDDMVNVAQETYFYARNLPISATEQEQIAEIIHAQLMQKTFITDVELRSLIEQHCPAVAINTEEFTTWGLRNALGVLLRDRFSFNGAIISDRGQEINMSQAFEAFCESHDEMTLNELRDFAKEMNPATPVIYWDAVFNKMLRISRTDYVRKSTILFPVEETDAVLDMLLESDYIPIRKFSLFLHFPPISVKWNEFVLEGYVAQYSRSFVLLHASYTANECCGAIVRRNSRIKDFKSLVVDVLAHTDGWKTQDDALELLVRKGYLQRKRYSEIGTAITEACLLKNRLRESKEAGL